jgi:hypothetical protein
MSVLSDQSIPNALPGMEGPDKKLLPDLDSGVAHWPIHFRP